jgi:three-Cys-motif partner protein
MKPEQLRLFDLPETQQGMTLEFSGLRHPVWTENKARLIARYLYYFILITKHGVYIDGFAGPQHSDQPDSWAARSVLEIEPRWFRYFFLCDRRPKKVEALHALRDAYPSPDQIELYLADFNEVVYQILRSGRIGPRVAAFCLLDQHTFECEWRTVEALARHKEERKIELFYFVSTGWLDRAFSGLKDLTIAERWWGSPDWHKLKGLHQEERANLFCERFRQELGYKFAYPFPIYDRFGTRGRRVMYHMIHATDHPDAPHLMARAYRKATGAKEPPEQFELELEQWRASRADEGRSGRPEVEMRGQAAPSAG